MIGDVAEPSHDDSIVDGIELDVYLYPVSSFDAYDIMDFIQVWDGTIICDEYGILAELKKEATAYIDGYAKKSDAEIKQSLNWCEKMLRRTQRRDIEGLYRLHWLLADSLEIFDDVMGRYYLGPKKALRHMEQTDDESARIYHAALLDPSEAHLQRWIERLKNL